MDLAAAQKLREFLRQCLAEAGDHGEWADHHSLFASGRLDSLAMTRLVLFLEEHFGVDFGAFNFDAQRLDSLQAIEEMLGEQGRGR